MKIQKQTNGQFYINLPLEIVQYTDMKKGENWTVVAISPNEIKLIKNRKKTP